MPEQNDRPRHRYQTLDKAHEVGQLVRVKCANCYIRRYFVPADLIAILGRGDLPYWIVEQKMRCERCRRRDIVADVVFLSAAERMTVRVRRSAPASAASIAQPKNTVQQLIDERYKLTAYCHNYRCNHNKVLDLQILRERLGPDGSVMHDDLVPKLRCEKCGGKDIGLILAPPTSSVNPYERNSNSNLYQKAREGR